MPLPAAFADAEHEKRVYDVMEMIQALGDDILPTDPEWIISKLRDLLRAGLTDRQHTIANARAVRQGGVLFVAAEGANQIPIRLEGVVEKKLRPAGALAADLEQLPFAWIRDCPNLQNDDSFAGLLEAAKQAAEDIRDRFDLPLALIIIDTLSAAGNFKDANDAAEGQFIMNRLGELSRQTGAFALAVDHFGKQVDTGTRGSSAKEAAADVVLALLANREINGKISKTCMALRKLRGGQVGIEMPFSLKVEDMGFGNSTCVVEWKTDKAWAQAATAGKDRWTKSLLIFKSALKTAVIDHGKPMQPFGSEGPKVRAVPYDAVRREFMEAYPVDASDAKARDEAKRKAFTRALKGAHSAALIGSREIGGIDYLWLSQPEDERDIPCDGRDTP